MQDARGSKKGMSMRPAIVLGALALSAAAAFAADDPIAARQAIMDGNGAAAAVAGGILKDEIPYEPALGKLVIAAFNATSHTFQDYFPEGSADPARSGAAPKIWEDPAGFDAALAKFSADVAAAQKASGKDGPADKAAFQAAIQPVLGNCKTCHETFRLKN
jgi:cytochrome c556